MPPKLKVNMAKINCKRIKLITPVLFIFSIAMLIVSIIVLKNTSKIFFQGYFYSILAFLSLSAFFISTQLDKFINIKPFFRNMPIYYTMFFFIGLCAYIFYFFSETITAILLFILVSVIVLVFFYIEPLIYIIIIFLGTSIMIPKIISLFGLYVGLDFLLLIAVLMILSLFKWASLKTELEHNQIIERQKRILDKEIEMASHIQKCFYKHENLYFDDWEIAFYNNPMAGVSGDFYDFYNTESKLNGLSVFDISGHGISSGLLTLLVKNIVSSEFDNVENKNLKLIMENINARFLKEKGKIENYMTGILARIKENNVSFVISGHPKPIVYNSRTKSIGFFNSENSYSGVIGLKGFQPNFMEESISMNSGDQLIFYTDGIAETKNIELEEYGNKRFLNCIERNINKPVEAQIQDLIWDINSFRKEQPQNDDITIIILRKK